MAPFTRTLLGSELLEPGHGWDYVAPLRGLVTRTDAAGAAVSAATGLSTRQLAQHVIESYFDQVRGGGAAEFTHHCAVCMACMHAFSPCIVWQNGSRVWVLRLDQRVHLAPPLRAGARLGHQRPVTGARRHGGGGAAAAQRRRQHDRRACQPAAHHARCAHAASPQAAHRLSCTSINRAPSALLLPCCPAACAALAIQVLQKRTALGDISGADDNVDLGALLMGLSSSLSSVSAGGLRGRVADAAASYDGAVLLFRRDNELRDVSLGPVGCACRSLGQGSLHTAAARCAKHRAIARTVTSLCCVAHHHPACCAACACARGHRAPACPSTCRPLRRSMTPSTASSCTPTRRR